MAVDDVLRDPSYRLAADAVAGEIARMPAAAVVCEQLVDRLS